MVCVAHNSLDNRRRARALCGAELCFASETRINFCGGQFPKAFLILSAGCKTKSECLNYLQKLVGVLGGWRNSVLAFITTFFYTIDFFLSVPSVSFLWLGWIKSKAKTCHVTCSDSSFGGLLPSYRLTDYIADVHTYM